MYFTTELPKGFWLQLGLWIVVTATIPAGLAVMKYFNLLP